MARGNRGRDQQWFERIGERDLGAIHELLDKLYWWRLEDICGPQEYMLASQAWKYAKPRRQGFAWDGISDDAVVAVASNVLFHDKEFT